MNNLNKLTVICPICSKHLKYKRDNFFNLQVDYTFICSCIEYTLLLYIKIIPYNKPNFGDFFITINDNKIINYYDNKFVKNNFLKDKKILILSQSKLSNILDYIEKINLLK